MLVKRRGELHGTAPSQSWQLIGTKARRAGFQPAGSGGIPAAQLSAGKDARRTGSQDGYPTTARSMGSLHSLLRTHWDHEPPLTRPSATLSPSDGEREGVRGQFMESEHLQKLDVSWGHEPLLVSPLPALSPQGGERVAAGRERGWFMERLHDSRIAHRDLEPNGPCARPRNQENGSRTRTRRTRRTKGWFMGRGAAPF